MLQQLRHFLARLVIAALGFDVGSSQCDVANQNPPLITGLFEREK
jgi:hypothetical protein